jgi:hypothetical protein
VHTALSAAYSSLNTAFGIGTMNKFGSCFQYLNEHLKPKILLFSVAIGAMNAPQHWELRKERLTDIGKAQLSL